MEINPYEPPQADLKQRKKPAEHVPRKNFAWYAFLFFTFAGLGGVVFSLRWVYGLRDRELPGGLWLVGLLLGFAGFLSSFLLLRFAVAIVRSHWRQQ